MTYHILHTIYVRKGPQGRLVRDVQLGMARKRSSLPSVIVLTQLSGGAYLEQQWPGPWLVDALERRRVPLTDDAELPEQRAADRRNGYDMGPAKRIGYGKRAAAVAKRP